MQEKDLEQLAVSLMKQASKLNVSKVSIQHADFSVTVETHAPTAGTVCTAAPTAAPATQPEESAQSEPELDGTVVSAPLVGTFYAADAPEQPPFIEIGDQVTKGQTLCIIEAMKTMNSIECPCDGTVSRILVQNGDVVEYHQPLIVIA